MKLLMATILLAASLVVLLMGIDLIMGTKPANVIAKELNPFKIMETTEYILLYLFIFFLFLEACISFRNKNGNGNGSSS